MREVTVAASQFACRSEREANIATAERLVREAAAGGAQIILLQELFDGTYFCQNEHPDDLAHAEEVDRHPTVAHFATIARELGVVLPISFYERAGQTRFNSIAIIDADGQRLGVYRKSHIPHGSGYQEKFYFSPGDTGFQVWETAFGRIGVGICWDQWFPEAARAMALAGAEILFYPTAIGSELLDAGLDSAAHWRRVQQGHAGANLVPLVASNRVGVEAGRDGTELTFYGTSFIAGPTGEIVIDADRVGEATITAAFDLNAVAAMRAGWGVFRDRRPELYGSLLSYDGRTAVK
ncbi:MAG: N-carbamoylputrescine amidase [Pseudomonadota bacterium]